MMDFVASERRWVVLPQLAQLLTVDTGQQFTSNQVCEVFADEAAAMARAAEVGWTPDEVEPELAA